MAFNKWLLVFGFIGSAQAASLRTNDSQQFVSSNPARNYVKNSGAEKNDLNITDANNIVSRNTASTPIIKGDAQFGVDAATSGHSACWALDTLQGEAEGNAVGSFMFRGDASLYKAYVYNSTDARNASAETTLTNSTVKQDVRLFFVANPSKTYTLCVEATSASAAAFVMDDVSVTKWVGPGDVEQAEAALRATRTTTQVIATTATTKVQFNSATFDPFSQFDPTTNYRFTAKRPGDYTSEVSLYVTGVASELFTLSLYKNGAAACERFITFNNSDSMIGLTCLVSLSVGDYLEVNIKSSADTSYTVVNNPNATYFSLERFPPASSLLLAANAPGADWTSFTPTGSWTTNTTYTGFYQCDGGNLDMLVHVATSGAPTSAAFSYNLPSGFTIDTAKLTSTVSTSSIGQAVVEDNGANSFAGWSRAVSSTAIGVNMLQISGSSGAYVSNNGTYGVSQILPMTWASGDFMTIRARVPVTSSSPCSSSPSPWIKQNVVTSYQGTERVERARVNGVCAIQSQSGDWVSSVTGTGSGSVCTVNFKTGTWSAAPTCQLTSEFAATAAVCRLNAAPTTSAATVACFITTSAAGSDSAFHLQCQGPVN